MSKSFSFVFLEPGQKVLVVHRRLFEGDKSRFFVGAVDGFNEGNGLLKVTGYSFSESRSKQGFIKKRQPRTKILSLTSGTLMVYQLPSEANPQAASIELDPKGILWLKDGGALKMDLSESGEENAE